MILVSRLSTSPTTMLIFRKSLWIKFLFEFIQAFDFCTMRKTYLDPSFPDCSIVLLDVVLIYVEVGRQRIYGGGGGQYSSNQHSPLD